MSVIPAIDLSQIPFPELAKGEPLDRTLADLEQRCSMALAGCQVKGSSPSLKTPLIQALFKTMVLREQQLLARINSVARSVMLATASGTDLDHVAALYGVKRIDLGANYAADSTNSRLEDDDRLRIRARLAMDALSQSGTEGEYRFHALSASAQLKDVSVFASDQELGKVHVCLLSRIGRGGQDDSDPFVLELVAQALQQVRSVTDTLMINWARIHPYHVKAILILNPGLASEPIEATVLQAVTALIRQNHRLGKELLRDEFFAALYQPGIAEVILEEPATDLTLDLDSAPYNAADPEDKDTLLELSVIES